MDHSTGTIDVTENHQRKSFPVSGFPFPVSVTTALCGKLETVNALFMKIERFEEIDAWQLARELTKKVYALTGKSRFSRDYGLSRQIQNAAGSTMHNIAEGFDSDTSAEFLRFLRYAKRSCSEVQSELYVALDQNYLSESEFKDIYDHAGRTRATIRGFIKYLLAYAKKSPQAQRETGNQKRETKK